MQLGEWKSAAVLNYADSDAFDQGALLARTIEESDSSDTDDA